MTPYHSGVGIGLSVFFWMRATIAEAWMRGRMTIIGWTWCFGHAL
jgi:hypothetical protein